MNAVTPLPIVGAPDRRRFIGGSDAGAILGLSPWKSRYELWLEKTGDPIPEDPKKAKIFRRGKVLEPYILEMLRNEKGIVASAVNVRSIDPEHPFLACETDATTDEDEDVELKTVHPFAAKEWGEEETDEIPPVYTAQALHGLMITGKKSRVVAALIGADDLRVYRVERDEPTIAAIRQAELDFWQLVQTRTVPAELNLSDLNRLYGVDSGQVIECADERVIDALTDIRMCKSSIKEIEQRLEEAQVIVKGFMKEAAVMTIGGKKACSWKTQTANRVDVESLRFNYPDIAASCTKVVPSRVFRVA
jgi:putative phage-type endonuclease